MYCDLLYQLSSRVPSRKSVRAILKVVRLCWSLLLSPRLFHSWGSAYNGNLRKRSIRTCGIIKKSALRRSCPISRSALVNHDIRKGLWGIIIRYWVHKKDSIKGNEFIEGKHPIFSEEGVGMCVVVRIWYKPYSFLLNIRTAADSAYLLSATSI